LSSVLFREERKKNEQTNEKRQKEKHDLKNIDHKNVVAEGG